MNRISMDVEQLKELVKDIVAKSKELSSAHISEKQAPVNYACIFTHSTTEFEEIAKLTQELGSIVQETPTGPVFYIAPLETASGTLRLLKIRKPDPKRPERGDADFTIKDYSSFKSLYLGKPGFNIIVRADYEMIELIDPSYDVIAYYSHPTLTELLKLNG